jgi:hypothetical protein
MLRLIYAGEVCRKTTFETARDSQGRYSRAAMLGDTTHIGWLYLCVVAKVRCTCLGYFEQSMVFAIQIPPVNKFRFYVTLFLNYRSHYSGVGLLNIHLSSTTKCDQNHISRIY